MRAAPGLPVKLHQAWPGLAWGGLVGRVTLRPTK